MAKITLGHAGSRSVSIDLDILLRTRLLVQANSGGGKSFLIRRLLEQAFGKVQQFVIDAEGEFKSLRDKYDFVLVGKGGETAADPRSAALLAHRLLELKASAICDIYELKPDARHAWVRRFLEAMVDAPKQLWRPVLVYLDEAHSFAPEKGQGESEASGAVIDLATRGRKRGFCLIPATQRLGKLSKNAAAELLNVLIGQTFIDVDMHRAAEALGIPRGEERAFAAQMKVLEPGHFFALGRAITKERVLVKVGPVETFHPEPGSARHAAEPPPAPAKVKALLPQLADLPKEADEKAKTEADFRTEIRALKAQLAARPVAADPRAPETVKVEVPVISPGVLTRLSEALKKTDSLVGKLQHVFNAFREFSDSIHDKLQKVEARQKVALVRNPVVVPAVPREYRLGPKPPEVPENGNGLGKAEKAILAVLAQYPDGCEMEKIALLSGYRMSGGFRNSLSTLRTRGYLTGGNLERMAITPAGMGALGSDYHPLPQGPELTEYWKRHRSFGKCERAVLAALLEHPDGLTLEELAQAARYGVSGGFRNALSNLRTAGVIVGKNTERMRVTEDLLQA